MEDPATCHVHDLNNDSFRAFVQNNDSVAAGFVLPWQKSYERFSREFDEVQLEPICGNSRKINHVLILGSSDNAWNRSSICESRLRKRT